MQVNDATVGTGLGLDVAAPWEVSTVLRRAAEQFRGSAGELAAAWQHPAAGRVWEALAAVLDRAAEQADRTVPRHLRNHPDDEWARAAGRE